MVINQNREFFGPLIRVGWPLMKIVLTSFAKTFWCFDTIRINGSCISNRCSYLKENLQISNNYTDNLKQTNER